MTDLFINKIPDDSNDNRIQENSLDFTTTLEGRITILKEILKKEETELPKQIELGTISPEHADLKLRCLVDILKDLYDEKYIGAPFHKQEQLSLFPDFFEEFEPDPNKVRYDLGSGYTLSTPNDPAL